MKRARFITFEGVEGSGKSTQIRAAKTHYETKGLKVFATREPGGSPLSDGIRGILLKSTKGIVIDPVSELLLLEAARRQHVVDVLQKELVQNDLVLCDRFTDSSLAYQGGGRGLDMNWIRSLNDRVTGGLTPDLTLLFDLPPDQGLPRAINRMGSAKPSEAEDRFEREGKEFHESVRETYLALARKEPARFFLIDATGTPESITQAVVKRIDAQMGAKK